MRKAKQMEAHPFFTSLYAAISLSFFLQLSLASDTMTLNQSISDGDTLVSFGHNFELGFFSPGDSKNRYLGIWYKITPGTVVWVANKDNPITDSHGVLTFSKNERLVLLNQTRSIIWSSNSSKEAENPVARLLNSGNLVLEDSTSKNTESCLWQSFDYLTNSWIAGMKIGLNKDTGLDQYLTSWKSTNDPSNGDCTYKIQNDGLPQMVLSKAGITKFRNGPWNGLRFNGIPPGPVYRPVLVFTEDKLFGYSEPYNNSVITRVTLNQSGLLNLYILQERSTEWAFVAIVPNDPCDNYGECGTNSVCRIYKSPICECLNGFIPKSLQKRDIYDWSSGCIRRKQLDCQRGEGFAKVVRVKLPDLLDVWLNKSMNLKECNAECLKNCSCIAYAISSINGTGCLMWFGDLIDIRELTTENIGQDIYIRLSASEQESIHDLNKKKKLVIIPVTSIVSGMLILVFVLQIIWKKRKTKKGEHWDLPLFDFDTIATATNNFSSANMLGVGGFGPVYKVI
ncbi:hypothetical protein F0562_010234 [Nyssa sinensis]|uniref:Bulb-type lectin domain-containing protein n=1 Tax=Nyssa sinensis TaxID=561372 RepID=A0A5J5A317_9ASTE|nr:hypothetical protein F0562_010234 [Nyssa sinensis]